MEETMKLLRILNGNSKGLRAVELNRIHHISEDIMQHAGLRGLITYHDITQNRYWNIYKDYFYCVITPLGSDYLITGGAEGLMKRDKENKSLSEKTLLVSKRTFLVSCIALCVSFLALLATIVLYFLSK